jgi:hypothetical protein
VKTVGLNLNCQIDFENVEEAEKFQALLLPEKSRIIEIISEKNIDISLRLRYPYAANSRALLTIRESSSDKLQRQLSFNYEFDCFKGSQTDWPMVIANLENTNKLINYFSSIIEKIRKAI